MPTRFLETVLNRLDNATADIRIIVCDLSAAPYLDLAAVACCMNCTPARQPRHCLAHHRAHGSTAGFAAG